MLRRLVYNQKRQFSRLEKIFGKESLEINRGNSAKLQNFINGEWVDSVNYESIPNPLTGKEMYQAPLTNTDEEVRMVLSDMSKCPKSGLHNPFKNPQRYREWGEVMQRLASTLQETEINDHFHRATQLVMPKSDGQITGELVVTRRFIENFAGDNPRLAFRGFSVAGDHHGQMSNGYRFPFGPVCIISPFNFPYEIPILQTMGALMTGNKVLLKVDSRVSHSMQNFIKLMFHLGAPTDSLTMIHSDGRSAERILVEGSQIIRNTQFTGSSTVAERLCEKMKGKVRIEDAGLNWKVLGPDVGDIDYVAYQCDQDSFAAGGQKCSATSVLICHENWMKTDLLEKIKGLAEQRNLKNLTNSPVLTWSNEKIQNHVDKVLAIPGAKLLFGGEPVTEPHTIPSYYGSYKPTAVYVPFERFSDAKYTEVLTTELFGPFYLVTDYKTEQLDSVIDCLNNLDFHLTASVVSNDIRFINKITLNTVNGVTYVGRRARTTGAPQNHWFGPSGDPRGTGIGTAEGIQLTWTCHREIVHDFGEYNQECKPGQQS